MGASKSDELGCWDTPCVAARGVGPPPFETVRRLAGTCGRTLTRCTLRSKGQTAASMYGCGSWKADGPLGAEGRIPGAVERREKCVSCSVRSTSGSREPGVGVGRM